MAEIFDNRAAFLGEGLLWHPLRDEVFWFDIINRRLHSAGPDGTRDWQFDELHSAAAWIDADHLLIASETGLWRFHIESGKRSLLVALEADNPVTRSNDGRADPWGGFWIGTMGKRAEAGAGSIWRYHRGELRRLHSDITITNAICFDAERGLAYFADTRRGLVWRQRVDADGWPAAEPEVFLDLGAEGLNPDGAITDATGALWIAQWGAGRVARYLPDGSFDRAIALPAPHTSCPGFVNGRLLVTTAQEGLDAAGLAAAPHSGKVFDLGPVEHAKAEPGFRP